MSAARLRAATPADSDAIKDLAISNGMFESDEMDDFDEMLGGFFDGSLDGHRWIVADGGPNGTESINGAAYYAPEPFADRLWNLYFIATSTEQHGSGVGSMLIEHVEQVLREAGEETARVLIVDTSSLDAYEQARAFYLGRGFVEEARLRDFYGPGDHKVTYWKSLVD